MALPAGNPQAPAPPPFEPDPGHAGEGTESMRASATPPTLRVGPAVAVDTSDPLRRARVLLVAPDARGLALYRYHLEQATGREADIAATGDEALDALAAAAQQIDLVALWLPLPDWASVDVVGTLRRNASPVRVIAVSAGRPRDIASVARLAGIAAVDAGGSAQGFVDLGRRVLADKVSVADIVASHRVPRHMPDRWAEAVYGTRPGSRFHADLD
jgi:CheY-like chemotaxis protein